MGNTGGGSSNPKYAGLTGYKMAGLWQEVKLGLSALWSVSRELIDYREKYTRFRDKWGTRPPRNDKEWLNFWQEFVQLEDALSTSSTHLLDAYNSMRHAADEGIEVVRLNGIDDEGVVTDPVEYQERSLTRVKQLLKILD